MKKLLQQIKKNLPLVIAGGIILVSIIAASTIMIVNKYYLSSSKIEQRVMRFIEANPTIDSSSTTVEVVGKEYGLNKLRITISEEEYDSYVTANGKFLFPQAIDLDEYNKAEEEVDSAGNTIGTTIENFTISDNSVCEENERPIVYFFGSESCPHCLWEHPIMSKVISKFGEYIVYHDNMDNGEDGDIFQEFSTGGVPTTVIGCKYSRVGSGESVGEEQEENILTALICSLTNNQPGEVCDQVQNLINQI